jgi:hypothetical protein
MAARHAALAFSTPGLCSIAWLINSDNVIEESECLPEAVFVSAPWLGAGISQADSITKERIPIMHPFKHPDFNPWILRIHSIIFDPSWYHCPIRAPSLENPIQSIQQNRIFHRPRKSLSG